MSSDSASLSVGSAAQRHIGQSPLMLKFWEPKVRAKWARAAAWETRPGGINREIDLSILHRRPQAVNYKPDTHSIKLLVMDAARQSRFVGLSQLRADRSAEIGGWVSFAIHTICDASV